MNLGFQFKEFYVRHDACAMKVGTDAVLLGLFLPIKRFSVAAELGTGSGVISLMLAQLQPNLTIDAIEINHEAFEQAKDNFVRSPFAERLSIFCQCHTEFRPRHKQYDLVFCNPPFFLSSQEAMTEARTIARSLNEQTHLKWFNSAFELLMLGGAFYFILPTDICIENIIKDFDCYEENDSNKTFYLMFKNREEVLPKNKQMGFAIEKLFLFQSKPSKHPERIIMGLKKIQMPNTELLTPRDATSLFNEESYDFIKKILIRDDNHHYTDLLKMKLSPFYLKY